jgi:MFS superfamily sulfate permease-like transporter
MRSKTLVPDIKAGIVVFLVALPLCLGIALACKAPLFSGLLAGMIGGIIVTTFSGSVLSVSGPAAGLTSIVLSSVASLGSFEAFMAAVLIAGLLQVMLGLLRVGSIGNYFPNAVIKGMLAGIGIILIIKQIPHLVGYDADPEGEFDFYQPDGHTTFSDLIYMLNYITPGSVAVGLVSLAVLFISEREFYKKNKFFSMVPGALLAVGSGILLNVIFNSFGDTFLRIGNEHLVNLPMIKGFSDIKDIIIFPDFSLAGKMNFWVIACTIALVASLESLLSIEAVDKLDPKKRDSDSNKELLAQGLGNFTCGLIGALPVTAVIVRSSANINAGAKTRFASMFHALLLLISILFIPHILMLIPNASLAAILIATGYKLAKPSLLRDHFNKGYHQVFPFIITIFVMLVTDLLKGVTAGLIVSVIYIIRGSISSSFDTAQNIMDDKMHHLIKLPQHVTFFNKGFLIRYLKTVTPGSKLIIDGSINRSMDSDVKEVLEEFISTSKEKRIETSLINLDI